MGQEALLWVKAAHIFGMLMWVGTLMVLYQILFAHKDAGEGTRKGLSELARRVAMAMDFGATVTIAAGVVMLVEITPSLMKMPWMHVKLTAVVLFLGFHVYGRIKTKKLREGSTNTPPPLLFALLNLILIAIVIMAVVKPIK